ncbi:hypothetical protein F5Y10DRAFT_30241 [Nemania abortiva]|nr:hypothetical protein F5Y10DRAFT_30241 [Nemania abortiva]
MRRVFQCIWAPQLQATASCLKAQATVTGHARQARQGFREHWLQKSDWFGTSITGRHDLAGQCSNVDYTWRGYRAKAHYSVTPGH